MAYSAAVAATTARPTYRNGVVEKDWEGLDSGEAEEAADVVVRQRCTVVGCLTGIFNHRALTDRVDWHVAGAGVNARRSGRQTVRLFGNRCMTGYRRDVLRDRSEDKPRVSTERQSTSCVIEGLSASTQSAEAAEQRTAYGRQ